MRNSTSFVRHCIVEPFNRLGRRCTIVQRLWGITDPEQLDQRVPTVSITHERLSPEELATRLAEQAIFVWNGNFYALPLTEALDLEPEGMVRIGLLHYNTGDEVQRLLDVLAELG